MNKGKVFARLVYGKSLPRTLIRAVVLGGICYVLCAFCFRPTVLRGKSMEPTFRDGQIGLINKLKYRTMNPRRGDVVVISTRGNKSFYLKRVLAVSGERIEFKNGDLYVEGELIEEAYIDNKGMWSMHETIVPPGEFFVAGDNRSIEIYNHRVGFIPKRRVAGGLIL